jgi:CbiX
MVYIQKSHKMVSCNWALGLLPLLRPQFSCGFAPYSMERTVGRPSSATSSSSNDDLFDPLLSPHAYPNGVDAGPTKEIQPKTQRIRSKKSFGITLPMDEIAMPIEPPQAISSAPSIDVFDPTLSPHLYSNGTPDVVVGDDRRSDFSFPTSKIVGILLMDHGSKSDISNERLVRLADLYQQQPSSTKRIVRAAHMELASPSIRDGIENLISEGVDEIICHPYFLGPGRHVREDIPILVNEAVESLSVKIPVTITEPLGSNTDLMIQAIEAAVVASQRAKK